MQEEKTIKIEIPLNPNQPTKQKICDLFCSKKGCSHGDQCRYFHPILPKGVFICTFALEGKCTKGLDCPFYHPIITHPNVPLEMKTKTIVFKIPPNPTMLTKQKICSRYCSKEGCKFDGECKYFHPVIPMGVTICTFSLDGKCSKGVDCPFYHVKTAIGAN